MTIPKTAAEHKIALTAICKRIVRDNPKPIPAPTVSVQLQLAQSLITDVLESAVSTYWAKIVEYDVTGLMRGTMSLKLEEYGDEEEMVSLHTVTRSDIIKGLAVLAEKYPHHFSDILSDGKTSDMYTGDFLLQAAIFGDIKYS